MTKPIYRLLRTYRHPRLTADAGTILTDEQVSKLGNKNLLILLGAQDLEVVPQEHVQAAQQVIQAQSQTDADRIAQLEAENARLRQSAGSDDGGKKSSPKKTGGKKSGKKPAPKKSGKKPAPKKSGKKPAPAQLPPAPTEPTGADGTDGAGEKTATPAE